MTRTLKAKRGNRSLRKTRRIARMRQEVARVANLWPQYRYVLFPGNQPIPECPDARIGRTFRGWRHPQAVGR